MKKSANADIRNLFRKFGGDTGSYQEIQQDYVVDRAQKSWPIVAAMEKERVSAPTLRASAENPAARAFGSPGSGTVSSAAQHGAPLARRVVPAAGRDHQAEGARTVSGVFASQAAEPAAPPARPLFAALNSSAKPAVSPVRSLFSVQNVAAKPAQAGAFRPGSVQVQRSENDPLASVFSRLLNPQGAVAAPDKNLRSLFGFLKK